MLIYFVFVYMLNFRIKLYANEKLWEILKLTANFLSV